ncbi:MAG: hypothetical protein ACFFA1_00350 [Promethearchaeota archaeon]
MEKYIDALKKLREILATFTQRLFNVFPFIVDGKSLKERMASADKTSKRIEEALNALKTWLSEILLLLTAARSLLWHLETSAEESESVKEVKDRIRIFLIPEFERYVDSLMRETEIVDNRIVPLINVFERLEATSGSVHERAEYFKRITQFDEKSGESDITRLFRFILTDNMKEFERLEKEVKNRLNTSSKNE